MTDVLAAAGQTNLAADRLQEAMNGITDPALNGWLREQKAAYLHFTNPAIAQQQLGAAIRENPMVLRPAVGIDVRQARAAIVQAREVADYLGRTYADSTALVLGVRAVLDDIVWDKDRTDQAEAAWEKLGAHLGFDSMRPERLCGTGPDILWALSSTRHAVIELKTGCELDSDGIAKKDADQLGGSIRWNEAKNPGVTNLPVMVHPTQMLDERAIAVPGMRIITPAKLVELKAAVEAFAKALAQGQNQWINEQAVRQQLAFHRLTGDRIIDNYSVAVRRPV